MTSGLPLDEIIVETKNVGHTKAVVAIDPQSLLEVRFQVPSQTSRDAIFSLARSKLAYVLRKKQNIAQS